ncbi:unnamed protein product [Schistocephalus solidus]|nr:unnamed protein product [Schistocephalus solidus]
MDDHGKQCFHSVAPSVLANYMASQTSMWIPRRTATGIATAPNWFSDHSALFHRVPEEEMYVLEYLIYHLYPYGVFRDPGIYGRALRLLSVALPKNVLTR